MFFVPDTHMMASPISSAADGAPLLGDIIDVTLCTTLLPIATTPEPMPPMAESEDEAGRDEADDEDEEDEAAEPAPEASDEPWPAKRLHTVSTAMCKGVRRPERVGRLRSAPRSRQVRNARTSECGARVWAETNRMIRECIIECG